MQFFKGKGKYLRYLNTIPFIALSLFFIMCMIDDWIGFWIFLLFIWAFLGCLIWSVWVLVNIFSKETSGSRTYRNTIIIALATLIAVFAAFNYTQFFVRINDVDDIQKNYDRHETGIESLTQVMKEYLSPGTNITLEFKYGTISIFHVTDSLQQKSMNWNKDARDHKDSLMTVSGLDEREFLDIRHRLKKTRCIAIETSLPDFCDVWCSRVGMGLYSYRVYLRPLSEEEQTYYLKNHHFIPYNDHVLFMFDSSIGRDSFTAEDREYYLNKFQWKSKY